MNNRLSIPELEDQIATLQRQLRERDQERRRVSTDSMYVCKRCGCMYQSIYGCGCPTPGTAAPRKDQGGGDGC